MLSKKGLRTSPTSDIADLWMISAGAAMMGRQKPFDTCRMDDRAFPRQITGPS